MHPAAPSDCIWQRGLVNRCGERGCRAVSWAPQRSVFPTTVDSLLRGLHAPLHGCGCTSASVRCGKRCLLVRLHARLSILRCGSRWWQVWEDTESAAGNLRRDQHAPPHDGAAPCGFCLTRHRGTIHHAWRGEVASGAPPRRGQLTVALGVRFDSTKGSRIRRGALDWHPIHR